ncbi:MAG: GNAT family N-acetyltransferase [Alphaproteobacteria bacterium]|nr:GNAT family N-acetyltransferase [Alphaproteobacteria bacterium]
MQDHEQHSQSDYILSDDLSAIDWWRLANIMADAHLFDSKPFDIARAFHGSYAAVFAFKGDLLVGAARATSDGVFYASVFDVVVAPDHQRNGVGRLIMEGLLVKLPFDRIFLTSVFGKEPFYSKFGFLEQTNAMGCYSGDALKSAIQRGVLQHAND